MNSTYNEYPVCLMGKFKSKTVQKTSIYIMTGYFGKCTLNDKLL